MLAMTIINPKWIKDPQHAKDLKDIQRMMDAKEYREKSQAMISEKEFQAQVIKMARLLAWRVYHTFDSRRSESGFPDLCMARWGRLIFAELKSEKGRLTPAQDRWADVLKRVSGAEVYEWRPHDWDSITEILK